MHAIIMPPPCSKELRVGPFSYGLAQECLQNQDYESWMWDLARSTHLILDNGADELGQSLDPDIYRALIRQVMPYEIILPDKLQDSEYTISEGKKFLETGIPEDIPSVMAVVQGSTWEEWSACYDVWNHTSRVSVIGIVYDIDFDLPWVSEGRFQTGNREVRRGYNRVRVIQKLIEEGRLGDKPVHLLGFNNFWECEVLRSIDSVRSIDTRGPYSAGLAKVRWDSNYKEKSWSTPDQSKVSREEVVYSFPDIDFNVRGLLFASGDSFGLSQWEKVRSRV